MPNNSTLAAEHFDDVTVASEEEEENTPSLAPAQSTTQQQSSQPAATSTTTAPLSIGRSVTVSVNNSPLQLSKSAVAKPLQLSASTVATPLQLSKPFKSKSLVPRALRTVKTPFYRSSLQLPSPHGDNDVALLEEYLRAQQRK
jgi:hypothetical protein